MIRRLAIQWGLLALALMVYAWFPVRTVWHSINSNDFKHIYLGMKAILDGISPYSFQALHHQAALQGYQRISLNPYVYLPFTGHAMAFLAPFRLEQAVVVWFALNHLFLIASIAILSQLFPRWRVGSVAVMVLAMAFNIPLYRTLTAGQLNLALLFLICLSWHFARKNRPAWSGTVMAFAAMFKLMPALYALNYLFRRQWRAMLAMVGTCVALLSASIILAGPKMYLEFFSVLQQMSYGKSTWPEVFSFWDDPPNQSLNSFFTHILTLNDHTMPWFNFGQQTANIATMLATAFLLVVYVGFLTSHRRPAQSARTFSPADDASWCATLILALLIPSLMWDHYLVMLLLPVAWMLSTAIRMKHWKTAGLVILCYLVTSIPWNFEAMPWRHGIGIAAMSLKLWPTLILFGLSLCFVQWTKENVSPGHVEPSQKQ